MSLFNFHFSFATFPQNKSTIFLEKNFLSRKKRKISFWPHRPILRRKPSPSESEWIFLAIFSLKSPRFAIIVKAGQQKVSYAVEPMMLLGMKGEKGILCLTYFFVLLSSMVHALIYLSNEKRTTARNAKTTHCLFSSRFESTRRFIIIIFFLY